MTATTTTKRIATGHYEVPTPGGDTLHVVKCYDTSLYGGASAADRTTWDVRTPEGLSLVPSERVHFTRTDALAAIAAGEYDRELTTCAMCGSTVAEVGAEYVLADGKYVAVCDPTCEGEGPRTPAEVAGLAEDGTCVICGRPADQPYRLVRDGRTTEGCVAVAHPADHDTWAQASQEQRRYGVPVVPAAAQVQLLQVATGATVAWQAPMPSSDNPDNFLHVGVVGREVGRADLGNVGRSVDGCPCGFTHNVSRYTPVTVLVADGSVPPATVGYYDNDNNR